MALLLLSGEALPLILDHGQGRIVATIRCGKTGVLMPLTSSRHTSFSLLSRNRRVQQYVPSSRVSMLPLLAQCDGEKPIVVDSK